MQTCHTHVGLTHLALRMGLIEPLRSD